ncbi:DEAD/DEAH box helicase family protein [Tetragenococcus halophilus]|uniref:DEAD/DEAH box helicase family protein n=1 Tax=Tetragenococcus halophilus TaxID=51669 RepID=A0AB35HMZ7_TETHA|nr:DEAD/DEAH box helicase family protein [Tetragenococcus halophilus]MCO8297452.1 DEAD/DEAH box helicase family protein [Tetragenococcus halophilus]
MSEKTSIKTTKKIYPQIYAYTLPNREEDNGWVKIGYTERKDVETRIKEQTRTAAFTEDYLKLWSEPARFQHTNKWFKDYQLHNYLRKFKHIEQRPNSEWFYYDGVPRKSHDDFIDFTNKKKDQSKEELKYQLRSEQKMAVDKTLAYAKHHPGGKFLWNAKPRFGKTLTTYDLIRKMDAKSVLIVTNRPAIANSWFDDFEKFIAWQTSYFFISTSDSLKNRPSITRKEFLSNSGKDSRQITFISLQDLKGSISFGGTINKLKWVKDLNWDLLVIDEAHEGVDTFKTDVAFENIKRRFTLHLSGTPFKAVGSGKFSDEEIYNWTYEDEQVAKQTWRDAEAVNPYEKLPRLNLFSYQMSQMITEEVNQGAKVNGENIDYAFDLNEFFSTKDNGKFVYEEDVKRWLDTLTNNEKYPFSTKKLRNELKHTFWILNRVASAKALQKLLQNHPVFENYKVVLAAGDGKNNEDDNLVVNSKTLDRVQQAIKENDKTITLSVGQLTTGVTIPEWTAVLMLSNMKSPSLYMQAAFRAQNPCNFEEENKVYQKENAYVFDFAPERTLLIYDEFANNLSNDTSNGNGTTDARKDNIQQLLNFFPVIAEDDDGKMRELDVGQVLTIPKAIKAQEVVKRGFMSNLLFQNISGIFTSEGAREILEQLNPVETGKTTPRKKETPLDTKNVEVDKNGDAMVGQEMVVNTTDAHFGDKVFTDLTESLENIIKEENTNLPNRTRNIFKNDSQNAIKDIAKESGVTVKQAEQIVDSNADVLAKEVESVQKQAAIKQAEIKAEFDRQMSEAQNDPDAMDKAKEIFDSSNKKIEDDFKQEFVDTFENKSDELRQKSTEEVLRKAEDEKKSNVEGDVRARLRGFARTIPSFLMAYGEPTTTLENFDNTIKDEVFKEVTGITLNQFRTLRDTYHFFDEVVFNESIQEFLSKRKELANYFDETQEEDIFDYIPAQKTNQIYTPKRVVKMMVDKLEEEDPEVFKDPNKTFADLYMKSGLYITEIVKRLYFGLEDELPDDSVRLKHILEKQVFGFAPTEIIYNIAHNFIFGFNEKAKSINDSHVVYLDTVPYASGETEMSLEEKCDELFGRMNNEI